MASDGEKASVEFAEVYKEWKANSSWGQLFAQYQREGYLADKVLPVS